MKVSERSKSWRSVKYLLLSKLKYLTKFTFTFQKESHTSIAIWTFFGQKGILNAQMFKNINNTLPRLMAQQFGKVCKTPFFVWSLELRQYKNNSIQSEMISILKLPLFFINYTAREIARKFQNWNIFGLNGEKYFSNFFSAFQN